MRSAQSLLRAFRRWLAPREVVPVVRLDDVRRRLELLVTALYGREIPIAARPAQRAFGRLRMGRPQGSTDGVRVLLPEELDAPAGDAETVARYQLLAIGQAERLARGSAAVASRIASRLERDLFLIGEGAAVDAAVARVVPGLRPTLAAARAEALARRPAADLMPGPQRAVEALLQRVLKLDPSALPEGLSHEASPEDSLAWARAAAAPLRAVAARYRGIPAVDSWGMTSLLASDEFRQLADSWGPRAMQYGLGDDGNGPPPSHDLDRNRGSGRAPGDSPGAPPGRSSAASESPAGGSDAERREAGVTPEGSGAGAGDAGEARPLDLDAASASARHESSAAGPGGIKYPEWDWRAQRYVPNAATVHVRPAGVAERAWSTTMLAQRAAMIRRLREQFEMLRARRLRLGQQRAGDELDLAACVRALVDVRTGHAVDDRLYTVVRPARRELAIVILVDISGSTEERLGGVERVIDIEQVALLIGNEALEALGDPYAILAFASRGRDDVRIYPVKEFADRSRDLVRRRIAALAPQGWTRAGAAIRHATALLEQQAAGHRLLLILSDGKPNDEDGYQGRDAVEDTRQAIVDARARGVVPYCLTVDRAARDYLSRIFGETGHTILRHPDQLPLALTTVIQQLLARR